MRDYLDVAMKAIAGAKYLATCGKGWRLNETLAADIVHSLGVKSTDTWYRDAIAKRVAAIKIPWHDRHDAGQIAAWFFGPRGLMIKNLMLRRQGTI